MLDKQRRGIDTLRGRRSKEGDLERQLIANAGLQLSLASHNKVMAKEFGLAGESFRVDFSQLEEHCLPTPALALCFPEVLAKNFLIADQRFPRVQMSPKSCCDSVSGCFS